MGRAGRYARGVGLIAVAAAAVVACAKVPYTGRHQYNLVPDSLMRSLGKSSYGSLLSGATITRSGSDHEVLRRVGQRISRVADEPKYDWTFSLIADDTVNAWCLPGGYIGFYEGILPVLDNEAGMAFVMGHEVAHATAHHSAERLSQQVTMVGGLIGLYAYLDGKTQLDSEQLAIVIGAMGVATEVGVLLPFSRTHESEADVIGMMYMANAGYPPEQAKKVWDRMEKETGGSSLPTFLSTHPSNEDRQENLSDWMESAYKRYQRNRHKVTGDPTTSLWSSQRGGNR